MKKDVRRIVAVVTHLNAIMGQQVEELSSRKNAVQKYQGSFNECGRVPRGDQKWKCWHRIWICREMAARGVEERILEGKLEGLFSELCVDEAMQ